MGRTNIYKTVNPRFTKSRRTRWLVRSRCIRIRTVIIRLHRSTTYVDASYCCRKSSVVCRSVCLSLTVVSPAKTAELIDISVGCGLGWTQNRVLCPWHTLQKSAPETGARKLASVSGASVIQSGAEFFWRQILASDRTCSISRQNLATTWSKYWFVIGHCSMLLLFSFVGVVNFVCIFDYWNYLTYSVYLTSVGRIAR